MKKVKYGGFTTKIYSVLVLLSAIVFLSSQLSTLFTNNKIK
jgi:hypothetical protein